MHIYWLAVHPYHDTFDDKGLELTKANEVLYKTHASTNFGAPYVVSFRSHDLWYRPFQSELYRLLQGGGHILKTCRYAGCHAHPASHSHGLPKDFLLHTHAYAGTQSKRVCLCHNHQQHPPYANHHHVHLGQSLRYSKIFLTLTEVRCLNDSYRPCLASCGFYPSGRCSYHKPLNDLLGSVRRAD